MEEMVIGTIAAVAMIIFEIWMVRRNESVLLSFKEEIHKHEMEMTSARYDTVIQLREIDHQISHLSRTMEDIINTEPPPPQENKTVVIKETITPRQAKEAIEEETKPIRRKSS